MCQCVSILFMPFRLEEEPSGWTVILVRSGTGVLTGEWEVGSRWRRSGALPVHYPAPFLGILLVVPWPQLYVCV